MASSAGCSAHGVLDKRIPPLWENRPEDFPLAGEVLSLATALVTHSAYVRDRARAAGFSGRISVVPHPAFPVPDGPPADVHGDPLFGTFGNVNASKRVPQLLEAFARVRRDRPGASVLLVGAPSPGFDLDRRLQRLGLDGGGTSREGYVDEARLWELMKACDVHVNLRSPTMGETSGTAIRALSLGKPLVVSDVGWFAELPDDVALKVLPTTTRWSRSSSRSSCSRRGRTCGGRWARRHSSSPGAGTTRPRRRPLRRRLRAGSGRRRGRGRGARRRQQSGGGGRDRARLGRRARDRSPARRGRAR